MGEAVVRAFTLPTNCYSIVNTQCLHDANTQCAYNKTLKFASQILIKILLLKTWWLNEAAGL